MSLHLVPGATAARPRHAVCVLGFHRSGTSMVTRLLNLLGVDLGPEHELLGAFEGDNPRGYWEPVWLFSLNNWILDTLGGSYWRPPALPPGWERDPALDRWRADAHRHLDRAYGDAPVWGFKDPRLCLTLPFWQSVLAERGDEVSYVVTLRSPTETSASMARRPYYPGTDTDHWGRVWLDYTARALDATAGLPRRLVAYDGLLADGTAELRRLAEFLGMPVPEGAVAAEMEAAIDSGLRHHASTPLHTAADDALPAHVRAAYLGLRAAVDARASRHGEPTELADALEHTAVELWRDARDAGSAPPVAEVHVPIAATEGSFTRVRLLTASLRESGGKLADAPVIVTVSRDTEPYDLAAALPWSSELGIEWRWVDADAFAAHGHYATAIERFNQDFRAPLVVMLDADTVVTGPLDELLQLGEHDAIGGTVAHTSPAVVHADGLPRDGEAFWRELHEQAGFAAPTLPLEHPGWGFMDTAPDRRHAPAYFDLGVLAGSATTMRALGAAMYESLACVDRYVRSPLRCELALTLAIARIDCAWSALPVRWNFPNDERFRERYPEDAADIRVLRYVREDEVSRAVELDSPEGLADLLARRDLSPANELLRRHVAAVADRLRLPVPA
jgi:hypothetical protein